MGRWRSRRGAGEVREVSKVWVGFKKMSDVQGRFPGVNGGECSWQRRAREEVIGGFLILEVVRTDWGSGFVSSKLEGLESGAV